MQKGYAIDIHNQESTSGVDAKKFALWAGLASIVMFFIGITSAFIVKKVAAQAAGSWKEFAIPTWFYFSTAIIIVSSFTYWMAARAFKSGNQAQFRTMLLVTSILGSIFLTMQYLGWCRLVEIGIYIGGAQSNASGSFFYVISGAHAAHILGGLVFLYIATIKSFIKPLSSFRSTTIDMIGTYWHFVDILWIYLFILLIY
jgi:cytochrome c oxidase subunit 3